MPLAPRAIIRKWTSAKALRSLPFQLKSGPEESLKGRPTRLGGRRFDPGGGHGRVYGSIGGLEVRLAASWAEMRAAQRLRYKVFFEELSATPSMTAFMRRRDEDAYDPLCDHLLVIDRDGGDGRGSLGWPLRRAAVVGTYRILRQEVAERHDGFYSQAEYNVEPLLAAKSGLRFMELGRSCVEPAYRTKRAVELLWHGLWSYIREHGVDVMIGCASFPGTDPDEHAMALSFLHQHAAAPPEWRVRAHEARWACMDRVPRGLIDAKAALKAMPPLIKGYLRLGAYFGEGAVIDRQFGTTDVLVILPIDRIDPRYLARFDAPDDLMSRISPEAEGIM